MKVSFKEINLSDSNEILLFTDKWIGKNYFSKDELNTLIHQGIKNKINCSFKAISNDGEIAGVRITLAPGEWSHKMRGLSYDLWNCKREDVAYFKSLFVSDSFQKMGIGKSLSKLSIEQLKKVGTKAILCHSWLESPGNSSQRYLISLGFSPVREHPKFWYDVDYHCIKCGPTKCVCTAVEMIKYI